MKKFSVIRPSGAVKSTPSRRTPSQSGTPRRAAFGLGGDRAFRDPSAMVAPDQAFSAAMAQPQVPAAPAKE